MLKLEIYLILNLFVFINFSYGDDDSNCPTIKLRRHWSGQLSKSVDYQTIPVKYAIIHHTATNKCTTFQSCSDQVRNIQHYHMNTLGWSDIGYNFLIGNDGNVYEAVGWHKIGAHAYGWNSKSIGIAFIGNFENELPSEDALNAAKKLLECGVSKGELDRRFRLYAARQVSQTVSPGLKLYNEIQEWDNWSELVQ